MNKIWELACQITKSEIHGPAISVVRSSVRTGPCQGQFHKQWQAGCCLLPRGSRSEHHVRMIGG